MRRGLPLLAELLKTYGDEGLTAISFTAYAPELESLVKQHKLEHSITLVSAYAKLPPYVDVIRNGFSHIVLIGRNGKIRWMGDYIVKEKEFLKELWQVMNTPQAPVMETPLHAALDSAVSLYYDGFFAKAQAAAMKIKKKYMKKKSEKIVKDADYLITRIDEIASDLLQRMEETWKEHRGIPFVKAREALAKGFAKTEAETKAKKLEKEAARDKEFAPELKSAKAWSALLESYPILFPIEKNSASRSFTKRVNSFLKSYKGLSASEEAKKVLARRKK